MGICIKDKLFGLVDISLVLSRIPSTLAKIFSNQNVQSKTDNLFFANFKLSENLSLQLFALAIFVAASSAHYVPHEYHFVVHHTVNHHVKHESSTEKAKVESDDKNHDEPEKPANYDFKYEVHDEKTGDIKQQSETAHNGAVKGQYSLIDSDGFKRIVEYTADDQHGFQATVKREPTHFKIPEPAPKQEEPKHIHWW